MGDSTYEERINNMIVNPDDLFKKLEETGEEKVRQNLASDVYGPKKIPLVNEWLRKQEAERSSNQASIENIRQDKGLEITRSSRNAAYIAAFCAVIAVIMTIVTMCNNRKMEHLHLSPNIKSTFIFSENYPQEGNPHLIVVNTEDISAVSISIKMRSYTFNTKAEKLGGRSESYGTLDKKWIYEEELKPHNHKKFDIGWHNDTHRTNKDRIGIYIFDIKYYREADMAEYNKREFFFVESSKVYSHKEYRRKKYYKNILSEINIELRNIEEE